MTLEAIERALAEFERLAPKARTAADHGDPAPLSRLVDRVLAGESRLRDEGALRELRAIAPDPVDRFAGYLAFPFVREARARASLANLELAVGKARLRPHEAMARTASTDPGERTAALAALDGIDPALDELEAISPDAAPRSRARAKEPAKHGAILIPTPELMVELGLVSGGPEAPAAPAPDRSRELGALVLELVESAGSGRPTEYGALRSAVAGRGIADFRVRHAWVGAHDPLPAELPTVPIARALSRAPASGDAWSGAASLAGIGTLGPAIAFAATTLAFAGTWADPGSDRRRTARTFAAAVGLVAFDAHLVARSASRAEVADGERDALGFSRAPRLLRALWIGARFEAAPGEDTARYLGGRRLEGSLAVGAEVAFALRERFDEDWFKNPRVTREVVSDASLAATGSLDKVAAWLKELI